MFFLINYFFIGKSSQSFRVPVYHTYTAIDQSFFKQVYEYFQYAFRTFFVHRESRTVPIAGSTQFAQLFQDNTSMFFFPFPGMFQKFVAGQVRFLDALLSQSVYNLRFSSDRSMVGARYPTSIFPKHAGTTDQDILNGIVKHVSHMKYAGDVRGRNDDCVRLTAVWFRLEEAVIQPILIPLSLYFGGVVLTCNFHIVLF